jgi:hypothetical protein
VFDRINVDAGPGATLQLFASFGSEDNQAVFRVDFGRLGFFG